MSELAIQALEEARARMTERYKREMSEIDMAIARLRALAGAEPNGDSELVVDIPVKSGQYKGMALRPALELYVRERGGGPIDIHKAAADLELAGVVLGQEKERYIRNLRITVSNSRVLRYTNRDKTKIEFRKSVDLEP